MKHIKDPIHGYIDVTKEELTIVSTSHFQRLRRIKQLGLSSTVYPSATHTRFAHSLGVMHLAGEIAKSIDLPQEQVVANRVAGLLHDVGHLPYSHTLENLYEREVGTGHERISCDLVDEISENPTVDFPADKEDVKDIILGDYDGTNIISGEIDADRLDYLLRDSYNTGIKLGQIEKDTLIKFAKRIDGDVGFNHKSLKSVEQLLNARMQMNHSIYSHDTVNITETMLERATEFHIDETSDTIQDFIGLGDDEYNSVLTNSSSRWANELFMRVRDRNLYKTAYLNSLHSINSQQLEMLSNTLTTSTIHEEKIAEIAGVERHKVLISPPLYSEIDKFETPIETPNEDIRILENYSTKPSSLRDSIVLNQNLHVFCPEETKEKVREATEQYLETLDFGFNVSI